METSKETKEQIENFLKEDNVYDFTTDAIDEIYNIGTYNGVFSGENNGFYDRQNSVYGFLDTLRNLMK
jgi:hypothetical protein